MKLPNPERAVVQIEKLRDYCLSRHHLRGEDFPRLTSCCVLPREEEPS